MKRVALTLAAISFFSNPLFAGSYAKVIDVAALHEATDPDYVPPFAIVHPLGYVGTSDPITLSICVNSGDDQLIAPVSWAIEKWNVLLATTGNCDGCVLWEEPPPDEGLYDVQSAVLHELGHCAMGLGHVNLKEHKGATATPIRQATPSATRVGTCDVDSDGCCGVPTSFSASVNATEVFDMNVLRGDLDDNHVNQCPFVPWRLPADGSTNAQEGGPPQCPDQDFQCPDVVGLPAGDPARCCPVCPSSVCPSSQMQVHNVAWFRVSDNNPVVIDSTVIDQDSYSRSTSKLPAGHTYAANANRGLAESLGLANTQAVMYSLHDLGTTFSGLSADEVNMVKMALTGADRVASTADDYTLTLEFQADCTDADIKVSLSSESTGVAACHFTDIEESFSQNPLFKFHYSLVRVDSMLIPTIRLNPNQPWNFELVFSDGFESGGTTGWSSTSP